MNPYTQMLALQNLPSHRKTKFYAATPLIAALLSMSMRETMASIILLSCIQENPVPSLPRPMLATRGPVLVQLIIDIVVPSPMVVVRGAVDHGHGGFEVVAEVDRVAVLVHGDGDVHFEHPAVVCWDG